VLAAASRFSWGEHLIGARLSRDRGSDTFLPVDGDHRGRAIVLSRCPGRYEARLIDSRAIFLVGLHS
jgi:hypothetical protein